MLKVASKEKVILKQLDTTTNLGNGLEISNETQNRKDIITGLVICTEDEKFKDKKVYFPLYAALPLSYDGENYLVVDTSDILAIDD